MIKTIIDGYMEALDTYHVVGAQRIRLIFIAPIIFAIAIPIGICKGVWLFLKKLYSDRIR